MSDVLKQLAEASSLYRHYDDTRRKLMVSADDQGYSATKIAEVMGLASTGTVRRLIAAYRSGRGIGHQGRRA